MPAREIGSQRRKAIVVTLGEAGFERYILPFGVWYYPFILAAIGFPATFILKILERATKLFRIAWAISITGIVLVPVLLYLMVSHINATAG